MTDLPPIPLMQRTRLAHATLQVIADECDADILHIKGAALDPALLPLNSEAPPGATSLASALPRLSAHADVLVRPSHLKRYLAALNRHGWYNLLRFDTGGGADHSAVYWHNELCEADVHRSFPGIRLGSDLAFERLWQDRGTLEIAHRSCNVPSLNAQRLVLLLHAARNRSSAGSDVRLAWDNASEIQQAQVQTLAKELRAEVPLAAVTGRLNDYADQPDFDLWRLWPVAAESKFEFWIARIRAARSTWDRLLVISNPLLLKTDVIAMQMGRRPTGREIARFQRQRMREDIYDIRALFARRLMPIRTGMSGEDIR